MKNTITVNGETYKFKGPEAVASEFAAKRIELDDLIVRCKVLQADTTMLNVNHNHKSFWAWAWDGIAGKGWNV